MTTVQITDSLHNLTQLTGNSGLTSTRITCQYNMDTGLLLFTQSTLSTLDIVMNRERNLTYSLLHFIHTDVMIEVAQDIFQGTLLRNIAADICLFD